MHIHHRLEKSSCCFKMCSLIVINLNICLLKELNDLTCLSNDYLVLGHGWDVSLTSIMDELNVGYIKNLTYLSNDLRFEWICGVMISCLSSIINHLCPSAFVLTLPISTIWALVWLDGSRVGWNYGFGSFYRKSFWQCTREPCFIGNYGVQV